jgi:2-keto-3-deoxy-6-phosphogluconate aldolase
VPEAIVGAGTMRSVADAQAALAAGCRFAVSPGYTPEVSAAPAAHRPAAAARRGHRQRGDAARPTATTS